MCYWRILGWSHRQCFRDKEISWTEINWEDIGVCSLGHIGSYLRITYTLGLSRKRYAASFVLKSDLLYVRTRFYGCYERSVQILGPSPWKPTPVVVEVETLHFLSVLQVEPARRIVGLLSSCHGVMTKPSSFSQNYDFNK